MFKHFTRGGQTTMHAVRMFGQVSKKIILLALLLYMIVTSWYVCQKTTKYQWYLLGNYAEALLELGFQGEQAVHSVKELTGEVVNMPASEFINNNFLKQQLNNFYTAINSALLSSVKAAGLFLVALIILLRYRGKLQTINKDVRGALYLEAKHLKKFLKKHKKCSDLNIAGVPLVKNSETKHILIIGTTGSGKSICMMELMDHIRARKQRAIVYDDSGSFIQHYYRQDHDIILNPLDERCPSWNIWQEAEDLADFEAIAAALMPLHLSGNDPFWIHSARTIFATLADKLRISGDLKTKSLLRPMFSADLRLLSDLLRGTVAEPLVAESVEKMALSIKSTLSTYCKALMYLKEEGDEPLFSIKNWLQNEQTDSWIFIASNAAKLEALKPLISVWIDLAARSMLSLTPSFDRRMWFLIDELASLHRLSSLNLLLSQGRKYGVCGVTAFQDIHQLRAIYGRDEAEALLAMYNTNFCYRTKCPDTALWMSRLTGQREIIEKREGFSYGANDIRDGVSVHQERRKEPLILDSEFLKLNDCEAYLLLPENTPATKITLNAKKRPILSKALEPRQLLELSLTEKSTKNLNINTAVLDPKEPILKIPVTKKSIKTKQLPKQQIAELDF
jgi:type IV conjugative transfer system coupling protein TraD